MQLQPRVQASYLQQYLGYLITIDTIYGATELRAAWGVKVTNDAVAVAGQ